MWGRFKHPQFFNQFIIQIVFYFKVYMTLSNLLVKKKKKKKKKKKSHHQNVPKNLNYNS